MRCLRKEVDRYHLFNSVRHTEAAQVACKRGWVAGYVDDLSRQKSQEFVDGFARPAAWWIEHDQIKAVRRIARKGSMYMTDPALEIIELEALGVRSECFNAAAIAFDPQHRSAGSSQRDAQISRTGIEIGDPSLGGHFGESEHGGNQLVIATVTDLAEGACADMHFFAGEFDSDAVHAERVVKAPAVQNESREPRFFAQQRFAAGTISVGQSPVTLADQRHPVGFSGPGKLDPIDSSLQTPHPPSGEFNAARQRRHTQQALVDRDQIVASSGEKADFLAFDPEG